MRDEVVIAGAGPAGSIAALLLARAGCRVRLLDRATFPRDKLCGDTISPGTLDILRRLGIGDGIARAGIPIRGMVVTGSGGARVRGEYGRGVHGVSLLRRDLDWMLVQHAVEAGVSFEPGVLVQEPLVEVTGGRPRVIGVRVVSCGGAAHDIPAALTIAADGRRSRLAFHLGIAHHPARPAPLGNRRLLRRCRRAGPGSARCTSAAGNTSAWRPFPEASPTPASSSRSRGAARWRNPKPCWWLRCGAIRRSRPRFADARLVSAVAVLGPLAVDTTAAGVDGLLLAGDAAGFIDPMTGDGMHFAVRGAELAAAVALAALEGSAA